ncbi:hypothetical protein AALO_G00078590 [Alosa alosa]|uniref:DOMON domain-containing protein n=1 Tax=Alosa alosa TaxID=278164 RepID=A0AAV6GWL6_9TELE|nr:DBH-like monooxygenase protein 2 homolog [Alosa alosa]KAG5279513.1 hypothetical protein AALO_G00078590 [Alosa alosa]
MTCPIVVPLLVLVLAMETRAQEDPLLPFTECLDSEELVMLKWGFDDVQGNITFELCVNTTGWISFGLSPNGGMNGADIVIGGVNSDGYYFGDYHASGNERPVLDQKQSYSLLSLTETDGQTTMRFERSIKSCDTDDHPITELPVKLIYAYGQTDQIGYHRQRRGTKEVNLLKYMPRSDPTQSQYFDMTMLNFTIPTEETRYECRIINAPTFAEKQHIYRIEPLIDHLDLVHHLLLYKCPPQMNKTFQGQCYINPDHRVCFQVMAAWGVGGGDFEVPEHVGIPIGGDEGGCLYRLEIHYNNPTLIEGRVDNSGLRFHYTSQLRKHDAGVLMAGLAVAPGYSIPPNATSFHTYGVCNTSINTEAKDMQVFATGLHTHLAGRKVRVGHFRDGEQIGFMAFDDHYDFEYQEVKNLGKTKTLQMGDTLLVECTYDTANRTGFTWGGLGTQDEMCLAFLFYYPASNLTNCVSFPNMDALKTNLGASNYNEFYTILSQKTWDEEAVTEYERTLKDIPQDLMVDDGENTYWGTIDKISDMMESPNPSCDRTPPLPGPSNASNMASVSWILLLLIWAVICAF